MEKAQHQSCRVSNTKNRRYLVIELDIVYFSPENSPKTVLNKREARDIIYNNNESERLQKGTHSYR